MWIYFNNGFKYTPSDPLETQASRRSVSGNIYIYIYIYELSMYVMSVCLWRSSVTWTTGATSFNVSEICGAGSSFYIRVSGDGQCIAAWCDLDLIGWPSYIFMERLDTGRSRDEVQSRGKDTRSEEQVWGMTRLIHRRLQTVSWRVTSEVSCYRTDG